MSSTGLNLNSLGMNQSTATSGSGIDVTAVVNQILDAARAPERLWQQQQSNFTAQSNALTSINSSLSALQTAMQSLHRSEEHTSELQSRENLVCRLLLE